MNAIYHVQVLHQALAPRVSSRALQAVTGANLGQDSLLGLLQPHYHFDNALAPGLAYIEACRAAAACAPQPAAAWAAFGRLSHAAQDFYSHSNYVALWLEALGALPPGLAVHVHGLPPGAALPPPDLIDGLDPALLRQPRLVTGRIYLADALALFPRLNRLAKRLAPPDSHAWMNLDSPAAGPLFPYTLVAAAQRTLAEFERTLAAIGETRGAAAMAAFLDL